MHQALRICHLSDDQQKHKLSIDFWRPSNEVRFSLRVDAHGFAIGTEFRAKVPFVPRQAARTQRGRRKTYSVVTSPVCVLYCCLLAQLREEEKRNHLQRTRSEWLEVLWVDRDSQNFRVVGPFLCAGVFCYRQKKNMRKSGWVVSTEMFEH